MALMVSTTAHYHWVKSISAETLGQGALKITLHGATDENMQQFNTAEITIFLDNFELTDRLIAAINGAAVAPAAEEIAA